MDEAEACLREVICPNICLQVKCSNAGVVRFYSIIGCWVDDVESMGKRLEEDSETALHSRS